MFGFVSDPSLTPASPEDASIQRAERQLRMLQELAEIGMDLARALRRRVESETDTEADAPPPAAGRDPADAFQRLSRAIRLTLALETKVAEALRALIAGEAAAVETGRAETARRDDEAQARRREATHSKVVGLVGHAIYAEIDNQEALWDCLDAMDERLDEDEAYEGYADRPLRETVERLCADLGLTPDWSLWTDEGWVIPPAARRPAYSVFHQPNRAPYGRERANAPPPRLE